MSKKMSISKDAHDLYVKHYGDDYDESVYPSIRSMTAIPPNVSSGPDA